jgi:hypothetical protein
VLTCFFIRASFLNSTTSETQVKPSATPMHSRDAPIELSSIHRKRYVSVTAMEADIRVKAKNVAALVGVETTAQVLEPTPRLFVLFARTDSALFTGLLFDPVPGADGSGATVAVVSAQSSSSDS